MGQAWPATEVNTSLSDPADMNATGPVAADGYRLRPLEAGDEAELRAIHARQLRATGIAYAWPELFADRRYYRAYVLERDGRIEGCLVAHATTEVFVIADRPRVLRALLRRRDILVAALREAGADELHAFVPRTMLGRMRYFLGRMGMRRSSDRFLTFYREL